MSLLRSCGKNLTLKSVNMEQFERKPIIEQSQRDTTVHRTFERNGETYEEDVLLYEPKERYQDDLQRLDIVITRKKQSIFAMEEKLRAHVGVDANPLHLLEEDIAHKVAYAKKEIERLETIRMITVRRLGFLAVQDSYEKRLLDNLPTDVEN